MAIWMEIWMWTKTEFGLGREDAYPALGVEDTLAVPNWQLSWWTLEQAVYEGKFARVKSGRLKDSQTKMAEPSYR